jgi:3-hydroxyisobutyrate dehydrogenase-like beta-hydroxyacid dehydrogenase
VVKLAGNFLIASTIESLGEACALAENHGVEREAVVSMLTSTIFDCLIYKGYGQRVGGRDHQPGGFALDLGKKDISLVLAAADAVQAPMPIASLLRDRFLSAQAAGWGGFDWSAIGLKVSADAGVDVAPIVTRTKEQIKAAALAAAAAAK